MNSVEEICLGCLDESVLKIPIAVVVIGSVASLLFLIVILILTSNRERGKIQIYFQEEENNGFI